MKETLVFFLALLVWAVFLSALVGSMGCGRGQRRECADSVAWKGDKGDACREGR